MRVYRLPREISATGVMSSILKKKKLLLYFFPTIDILFVLPAQIVLSYLPLKKVGNVNVNLTLN